jgi:ABC-type glycerol-3-phosphate transport system substrate-binding protein
MSDTRVSRRIALHLGAATVALPLVHIRTAGAAGKLSIFFWDHWVPAGNDIMRKQVGAWAEKNKVNVQIDFITSLGSKDVLTINAEAQARSGHDAVHIGNWNVQNQAESLEPMNDVVGRLTSQYGPVNRVGQYLGKYQGNWLAVPSSWGTQNKGPCGRISILREAAGLDVMKMFPTEEVETSEGKAWTYDAMLKAAEACAKVGKHFAIGVGTTPDSVDTHGAIFAAFGAELVSAKGEIMVNSDAVRQVLEYGQRLVKFLPDNAVSFDDASNNRALISGQSALIWNPPSAWAVAARDAPKIAEDCWTFPAPMGPKGRFEPHNMNFLGVWKFSPNKTAAKELIEHLMQRAQVEERDNVVLGYDLPPFESMTDFKVWTETGPPHGTVFNYPLRKSHNAQTHIAAMPAPPDIAVQIYNRGTMPTMFAKLQSGQSITQVVAWAQDELEGFAR